MKVPLTKAAMLLFLGAALALASDRWWRGRPPTTSARAAPDIAAFQAGLSRLESGAFTEAMGHFDRALALRPRWPEALYDRALARERAGRDAEAAADLDQALALDPKLVEAFFNRALLRNRLGDPAGARCDLDEALRLRPDWPDALLNRGHARRAAGDADGANADYLHALERAPARWPFRERAIAAVAALRSDLGPH